MMRGAALRYLNWKRDQAAKKARDTVLEAKRLQLEAKRVSEQHNQSNNYQVKEGNFTKASTFIAGFAVFLVVYIHGENKGAARLKEAKDDARYAEEKKDRATMIDLERKNLERECHG
ncbi:hypothetical protein MKX03_024411 [Papaver bracteatum]|nr:hypothetical protein MKX03_024411 [Papaver bracteatum]